MIVKYNCKIFGNCMVLSYLRKRPARLALNIKHTTAPKSYRYLLRLMVSCDGRRIGWPLHKYDGLRLLHDLVTVYKLHSTLEHYTL